MSDPLKLFISYNRADRSWAEWIAWQLEAAGYSAVVRAWDIRPGENFVLEMQRAVQQADRTIAVLSDSYLKAEFTQPEWAAAFRRDPRGKKRKLLPVRVQECKPEGILGPIVYLDLVGLTNPNEARKKLLESLLDERGKPDEEPDFPGDPGGPSFPAELRASSGTKGKTDLSLASLQQSRRRTAQVAEAIEPGSRHENMAPPIASVAPRKKSETTNPNKDEIHNVYATPAHSPVAQELPNGSIPMRLRSPLEELWIPELQIIANKSIFRYKNLLPLYRTTVAALVLFSSYWIFQSKPAPTLIVATLIVSLVLIFIFDQILHEIRFCDSLATYIERALFVDDNALLVSVIRSANCYGRYRRVLDDIETTYRSRRWQRHSP